MDPAYKQTSVNAREMDKLTTEGKREAEEAEEARRKAEERALEEAAQRARELQLMRMKCNF
jgi:hypothetical protein